jgi:hypothetical protein
MDNIQNFDSYNNKQSSEPFDEFICDFMSEGFWWWYIKFGRVLIEEDSGKLS